MTAQIGPPRDLQIYESPRPELLRRITTRALAPAGTHVLLPCRSTQRLAAGGPAGRPVLALWPAELKEQATYLYGGRRALPMVEQALLEGWEVEGAPQLAFRNAGASLRLYLEPVADARAYATLFSGDRLDLIGAYSRRDLTARLWPALLEDGLASAEDEKVLELWLDTRLGRRAAFFRAGLRFRRSVGHSDSPAELRREVDAILRAASERGLD